MTQLKTPQKNKGYYLSMFDDETITMFADDDTLNDNEEDDDDTEEDLDEITPAEPGNTAEDIDVDDFEEEDLEEGGDERRW